MLMYHEIFILVGQWNSVNIFLKLMGMIIFSGIALWLWLFQKTNWLIAGMLGLCSHFVADQKVKKLEKKSYACTCKLSARFCKLSSIVFAEWKREPFFLFSLDQKLWALGIEKASMTIRSTTRDSIRTWKDNKVKKWNKLSYQW